MIIDNYLNDILLLQLKAAGIKYRYIVQMQNDIRERMLSLISFWNVKETRKGILLFSLEEAKFYFPGGRECTREFVVTTIRNSMLEIAASDNCKKFQMNQALSDVQIQEITRCAIIYFNQYPKAKLVEECIGRKFNDVYGSAMQKYPRAWEVVKQLANMTENKGEFCKTVNESTKTQLSMLDKIQQSEVICDGYTLEFDETLRQLLEDVISGEVEVFFCGCFKMISRNFEKVLHVLEILLENDKKLITVNYYISNEHLEIRKTLLKAAHNMKEVMQNFQNLSGLPPMLKEELEHML